MSTASDNRNYSSVSPSAKVLLLMKGHTDIPFALQAAQLISRPDTFTPDWQNKDLAYRARVVHFESRYKQVNTLLADVATPNMLELSSGFSFRGLQLTTARPLHFIDTDLPGIIETKQQMVAELQKDLPAQEGKLEIKPLNALDEQAFKAVTGGFAAGPLTIINEGLLMYLDQEEKQKLCSIIHAELAKRGGYWITADIYIKNSTRHAVFTPDDELQQFLDAHHIEDNKFDSMEAAANFFKENGFVIDKEAIPDYTQLGSLQHMLNIMPPDKLEALRAAGSRMQTTWRLRVAD